ncbi:zinc-dependent peptidase [Wenzhouxiangella sp. XN201]|uniref:M90 family metallopeptidase n=1 Tax=Wenzhouxiangella sp. XN201 TaxID=2710755 RepID=UPI0013CD8CF2|nr:M90 family metallopeptidase [Wenzhouxiangella sp. XN201]NEZ03314.1 zinc-dependent peptidase [Wenzhouxiangella sp. XN201]
MFRKWREKRWQHKVDVAMPSHEDIAAVIKHFPVLATIEGESAARLRQRSGEILASKTFLGAGGLQPGYEDCLAVALLAARPILNLGIECYADFHTFILYPDEFIAEEEFEDEAGVVSRGRDLRSGEAWARGPVVLSMADVMDSAQGQGFDVVAHELAHQIDQLNGEMDGFPPLHRSMDPDEWTRAFSAAYDRLNQALDRDEEPAIDPYAAESPAEYFAVTSEYFFDAPEWLEQHEPEVFRLLQAFYGIRNA